MLHADYVRKRLNLCIQILENHAFTFIFKKFLQLFLENIFMKEVLRTFLMLPRSTLYGQVGHSSLHYIFHCLFYLLSFLMSMCIKVVYF
jgi:hypothetical protein